MFNLGVEELAKLDVWYRENGFDSLETGAIGGDLTYYFTPTSLGTVVKVKHFSGKEIDLTEYEWW